MKLGRFTHGCWRFRKLAQQEANVFFCRENVRVGLDKQKKARQTIPGIRMPSLESTSLLNTLLRACICNNFQKHWYLCSSACIPEAAISTFSYWKSIFVLPSQSGFVRISDPLSPSNWYGLPCPNKSILFPIFPICRVTESLRKRSSDVN